MKLYKNNLIDNGNFNYVLLGKLRNTPGSIVRKFKYCNNNVNDLQTTLNCVFDINPKIINYNFETYHILNDVPLDIDINNLENDTIENDTTTKQISVGPFTPSQIKKAYSINNILPISGKRRTIVTIITAFNNPYLVRDVKKFGEIFKLPPCRLKIYNFSKQFVSNWAIETTLNVQWIYAVNPYVEIRVIQAASSNFKDMFNAINFSNNRNNFRPKIDTDVVNMSWGMRDNGNLFSYNNSFINNKTIYVASSGNNNFVTFPSCCTNVLAIGGTTLNLNSDNTRFSEKVWSYTGCGYSESFITPSYQTSYQTSNGSRITPDFSCVADPQTGCYIVINQRLYSIGGTSLSAPIYVGMLSILTQKRINENKFTYTSVMNKSNSIQPLLYNNINCFFDIINGSSGPYNANVGFDIASGLGVVNLENLIQTLG